LLLLVVAGPCQAYPNEHLPEGNTTVIATAHTKYFVQVFALGKDGQLWHRYLDLHLPSANWTDWIMHPRTNATLTFDADPAVGVNPDGTVEVFIRDKNNLDLWQIFQTDPTNADNWSVWRECSCVNYPGCFEPKNVYYWNTQPAFPTSDPTIVPDPVDGRLQLFYRGFDGGYYVSRQQQPGNHDYLPPTRFDITLE